MSTVPAAYYCPSIPDIYSTARYQHALAIAETGIETHFICHTPPPFELATRKNTNIHTICKNGFFDRTMEAYRIIDKYLVDGSVFCTTFHYEPVSAGLRTKGSEITWVADIYDLPMQYRLNNPRSHHSISSRFLAKGLELADRSVHAFPESVPHQYGCDKYFIPNGSPIDKTSNRTDYQDPVSMVWIGSPRWDRGGKILIQALSSINTSNLQVDIYGEPDEHLISKVSSYNLDNVVTSHGRVNFDTALAASETADFGYCVLPDRLDWKYATPIKVGEYLATGTIPIISSFPGMEWMVKNSALYANPNSQSVAERLKHALDMAPKERAELGLLCRDRAKEISCKKTRRQFSEAVGL